MGGVFPRPSRAGQSRRREHRRPALLCRSNGAPRPVHDAVPGRPGTATSAEIDTAMRLGRAPGWPVRRPGGAARGGADPVERGPVARRRGCNSAGRWPWSLDWPGPRRGRRAHGDRHRGSAARTRPPSSHRGTSPTRSRDSSRLCTGERPTVKAAFPLLFSPGMWSGGLCVVPRRWPSVSLTVVRRDSPDNHVWR
jgi:hypothetical protein